MRRICERPRATGDWAQKQNRPDRGGQCGRADPTKGSRLAGIMTGHLGARRRSPRVRLRTPAFCQDAGSPALIEIKLACEKYRVAGMIRRAAPGAGMG